MGPPDTIVTASDQEKQQVESTLRHFQRGGAMEYLVHWCGYDEAEDSWVSEKDLIHAQ